MKVNKVKLISKLNKFYNFAKKDILLQIKMYKNFVLKAILLNQLGTCVYRTLIILMIILTISLIKFVKIAKKYDCWWSR